MLEFVIFLLVVVMFLGFNCLNGRAKEFIEIYKSKK